MRCLRVPLTLLLLAAALFGWWVHPQVLDPRNVGWTLNGRDWGQNALGLAAYLRAGTWPGLWTPLILAPNGIHLLMMDSNPLLGLLLWPVRAWLPASVQFVGWMMLADVLLQVGFAWILMRERAPTFGTALAGTALLSLLPSFFGRLQHPNLAAHWLLLWGLWLFVDRARARCWGQWLLLIAIAGLIHNYLLLMVLALWGSAVLREGVLGPDRRGAFACVAAASGIGAWLIGWHGLTEPLVSTGTYGGFPMALDALWNPGAPANSVFLPASRYNDNQGFEGFQYLGAGLLLLLAAALAGVRRGPARDGMVWLVPALAVLTAVAVSDVVILGSHRLLHARPPQVVIDTLDLVRASGRLFWPAAYALVYAALVAVLRWRKAGLVLAAALVLQVADMVPMMAGLRASTARASAGGATFVRTRDPRWAAVIAAADAVDVQPPEPFLDVQLLEEVGWRAMLACRPMRFMYVSRVPRKAQARLTAERRAFLRGEVPAERLVLLYPGEPVPAPLRARALVLDGVTLIAPARPASPPTCSSSPRSAS
ncbi:DUF6311 domain-containing protein [Sphingomonas aracearum]|uniref:Glycosyltransferase RgtA/B/C/D-like domain-containing protein n=1 Tax=Sphingomonas aracearum TaxID=2283317 RepID=A0A369VY64_9SPHN|nr:DUF6311 domain-containing protein [Sphingomonas aracearum]RDE06002.1 hypothetical protein DVW87_12555 [Sphingomonas aracearum]